MLIEMLHLCLLMNFRAKDKPLYVITTPALWLYFNFVSGCSGVDNLRFIDIQTTHSNCCLTPELSDLYFSSASSVLSISSIPVKHCRHSYGLVLQLRNNRRIVYSGDCRPSEQLALAGKGCDMLIHEATFGDDMADDAIAKRHCTRSEALIVARDMNAGSVLLTHFSQRYPRQPPPAPDIAADDKEDEMSFLKSIIFGLDFLSFYCPSQIAAAAAVTGLLACAKEYNED